MKVVCAISFALAGAKSESPQGALGMESLGLKVDFSYLCLAIVVASLTKGIKYLQAHVYAVTITFPSLMSKFAPQEHHRGACRISRNDFVCQRGLDLHTVKPKWPACICSTAQASH